MSWKSGSQPTWVEGSTSTPKAVSAWRALATALRWLIITPAGVRVEPEVYCKYAMSPGSTGSSPAGALSSAVPGRSTHSTGAAADPYTAVNSSTAVAFALSVRTQAGSQSSRTARNRPAWPGSPGAKSGTAITRAYRQPRNAVT